MILTPRYDGPPIIEMDGPADDQRDTLVRQRRRMADALSTFTDEQWRSPSRCEDWTVQDVVAHLVGTNGFWTASIQSGLAGKPTRYLTGFDPASTPGQMVEPMRSMAPAETHEQFVESNEALAAAVAGLDDAGWSAMAEAPPGHLTVRLVAHHALWDAWVHERDVLLPAGIAPAEEPDEVLACLRYVAALAPAFAISKGPARRGVLVVHATDLDHRVVVDVDGAARVRVGAPADEPLLDGTGVELVDMLSVRAPFDRPLPDDARWLVAGLAEVFDAAPRA